MRGKSSKTEFFAASNSACRRREEPAQVEVLLDRERREDASAFGHVGEAKANNRVGLGAGDPAPFEDHATAAAARQPGDRPQRRRLSGAVAAKHSDDLAFSDFE
jgi:hypothetical protein